MWRVCFSTAIKINLAGQVLHRQPKFAIDVTAEAKIVQQLTWYVQAVKFVTRQPLECDKCMSIVSFV